MSKCATTSGIVMSVKGIRVSGPNGYTIIVISAAMVAITGARK
jgi:hypothetical protein